MSSRFAFPPGYQVLDFSAEVPAQPLAVGAAVQAPRSETNAAQEHHAQTFEQIGARDTQKSGNESMSTLVIHEEIVARGKVEVFLHEYEGQKYIGARHTDAKGVLLRVDYLIMRLPLKDFVSHLMGTLPQHGGGIGTPQNAYHNFQTQNWLMPTSSSQHTVAQDVQNFITQDHIGLGGGTGMGEWNLHGPTYNNA